MDNNVCYLCHYGENFIEIYGEQGKDYGISSILKKHFWFLIIDHDNESQKICTDCWSKTTAFHSFYTDIRNVQEELLTKYYHSYVVQSYDEKHSYGLAKSIKSEILMDNVDYPVEPVLNYLCDGIKSDNIDDEQNDDNYMQIDDDPDDIDYDDKVSIKQKKVKRKPRTKTSGNVKKSKSSTTAEKKKSTSKKSLAAADDEISDPEGDEQIRNFFKMNCDVCSMAFDTFFDARTHYKIVHKQAGYITCCGKKYFRRSRAVAHISKHITVKNFACEVCNKGFATVETLKNHMDNSHIPNNMKPFKCNLCTKGFMVEDKLTRHIQILHCTEDSKKFECNECGKKFVTKPFLKTHIKSVHEFAYAQICDICAKVFKSRQTLMQHRIDIHSDVVLPKIQCELCGIWLKNKDTLRKHITYHNDITRVCTVCGRMCPNKNALNKHMRTVHVEKTYKCTMCDKAFKKAISLKEHIACHTGESLYVCAYCPNTFKSNSNMHKHRKKSHPVEWLQEREKRGIPTTQLQLYAIDNINRPVVATGTSTFKNESENFNGGPIDNNIINRPLVVTATFDNNESENFNGAQTNSLGNVLPTISSPLSTTSLNNS